VSSSSVAVLVVVWVVVAIRCPLPADLYCIRQARHALQGRACRKGIAGGRGNRLLPAPSTGAMAGRCLVQPGGAFADAPMTLRATVATPCRPDRSKVDSERFAGQDQSMNKSCRTAAFCDRPHPETIACRPLSRSSFLVAPAGAGVPLRARTPRG
jgi:hypothetical protein